MVNPPPTLPVAGSEPSEISRADDGAPRRELWALPTDPAVLETFLREMFETGWPDIRFGPIIEGAAYEWRCPAAPAAITLHDGYLTVMFPGGGHFHLCIGDTMAAPPELRARRRPGAARLFRGFGRDGKPCSWGFEMENGAGDPMLSIFFPNPFIEHDDSLAAAPDWSRLAMWRRVAARWLGRAPEALDEQGRGFR